MSTRSLLNPNSFVPSLVLAATLLVAACVHLAGYDQQAYQNATSLKALTLAMMEKSEKENSFSENEAAVDQLMVRLSAAFEYANGVDHNNEAANNWLDLIGDDEGMIKGWVSQWRKHGSLSETFISEYSEQIAEGFDTIICLEANKRNLTACPSLTQ